MEDYTAKQLVTETFSDDFEQERYTKFARELLDDFELDVKRRIPWTAFENYVDYYETFGTYTDPKKSSIEVIAVKLKRHTSRDRARTMQRNFIAKYLETGCDAALVAFYGDDPTDWRFSFVKLEHALEKGEKKTKTIEKLTPVKRYSFLVGKNEPNHTCQKQFLELIKRNNRLTIEEIENAFSVDNVTEEFFDEYKDRYLELKETLDKILKTDSKTKREFEDKGIDTIDFAKKLLGQVVFLYFLQKKGWLGVGKNTRTDDFEAWGSGPKDFLRRLYNKGVIKYDNFFNEVLEPLFYEALAKQRDEDYYSKFKCKIPFLDGGLFEPLNNYDWTKARIPISNQVIGKILDTFDRFNFTVKEDEPLEKEVAVDPEMLGKVFEKMLEIKDRKSGGKYYTPREIVNYMCRQSLINYLETNSGIDNENIELFLKIDNDSLVPENVKQNYLKIDQLLKEIKIVDPAIGSGAFPVGMMLEIVKARSLLTPLFNVEARGLRTNYYLKRETIENCIYGVDIDFSAVEIAKLRFWLSLVVDEDDLNNVKPLPNLDHKLMVGNSLVEEFNGIKLFDEKLLGFNVQNDGAVKRLENKIIELQIEKGRIATGKQKGSTHHIELQISAIKNKLNKMIKRNEEKIPYKLGFAIKESYKNLLLLRKLQKQLFDAKDRTEKNYYKSQISTIEWELILRTLEEQGNEIAIKDLEQFQRNRAKPFFIWKLYFADIFQRENPGFDIVIANPPYDVLYSGDKQREREYEYYKKTYSSAEYNPNLFAIFMEKGLNLLRARGVLSFINPDTLLTNKYFGNLRRKILSECSIFNIVDLSSGIFQDAIVDTIIIIIIKTNVENNIVKISYEIEDQKDLRPQKFKTKEVYQKEFEKSNNNEFNIYYNQSLDAIKNKMSKGSIFLGKIANIKRGMITKDNKRYVFDSSTKNSVKNKDKLKGLLIGKDATRYKLNYSGHYILFDTIAAYGGCWDKEIYEAKEKLLIALITGGMEYRINAAYDNQQYYVLQNYNNLLITDPKFDIKYVLGLINSRLLNDYYTLFFKDKNIKRNQLQQLPIKEIDKNEQKKVTILVDNIIQLYKQQNKKNAADLLNKELDDVIYKLYGITEEDKKIIKENL